MHVFPKTSLQLIIDVAGFLAPPPILRSKEQPQQPTTSALTRCQAIKYKLLSANFY